MAVTRKITPRDPTRSSNVVHCPTATARRATITGDRHVDGGFPADGSIIYSKNESFWAFVGDAVGGERPFYSMWDITTKTVTNRPNISRDAQSFWLREFGMMQLEGMSRYSDEDIAELDRAHETFLD